MRSQSNDVYFLQRLQQNINRSVRRLARMTGRDLPSDHELRSNLHKRIESLNDEELTKRYNRVGVKGSRSEDGSLEARYSRKGVGHVNAVVPGHDLHGAKGANAVAAAAAAALQGKNPLAAAAKAKKGKGKKGKKSVLTKT